MKKISNWTRLNSEKSLDWIWTQISSPKNFRLDLDLDLAKSNPVQSTYTPNP